MAPVAKAPRRYFVELTAALGAYFGALYLKMRVAPEIADPTLHDIVDVLPIIPVVLIAAAIFRFFNRVDEYRRHQILESFALAAAATCVFAVCWMFLTDIGAPEISIFWVWPIQAGFWVLILLAFKLRDRASEGAAFKTIMIGLMNLGGIAALTGLYGIISRHTGWRSDWVALLMVATGLLLVRFGIFAFSKKSSC